MREHDLSHRGFEGEAAIDQACQENWNKLTPQRLRTLTATDWITHENESGCVWPTALGGGQAWVNSEDDYMKGDSGPAAFAPAERGLVPGACR